MSPAIIPWFDFKRVLFGQGVSKALPTVKKERIPAMPVGVIVNCLSVAVGGVIGAALKRVLPKSLMDNLPLFFGMCAIGIGITSIVKVQNMSAVVLTVLIGYTIGDLLQLEDRVTKAFSWGISKVNFKETNVDMELFVITVVLFCCSGFGWYGALVEGISGDPSLLFSKSILDFFTAVVFATTLGLSLCSIPVLQLFVSLIVFLCGRMASAFLTPAMFADLSACGGILAMSAGLRVAKIKALPVVNMLPALVLIMPVSALWTLLMG